MRLVLWNTEWAKPGTLRGDIIRREILASQADVICLTEAVPETLPEHGYALLPGDAPPYPRKDNGQKVLLWSRWPWSDVNDGMPGAPSGRFVEGTTGPAERRVRVTGVCVPWRDSHVRTGRRDRRPWEDHLAYLSALRERVRSRPEDLPEILLGDFNQRIPRLHQPLFVYEALAGVVEGYELVTAGWSDPQDAMIDHVAVRGGVTGKALRTWSKRAEGVRLSDHAGILLQVM